MNDGGFVEVLNDSHPITTKSKLLLHFDSLYEAPHLNETDVINGFKILLDSRQKLKNTTVDVSSVRTRYRGATLVNMNFYIMFALLITIQLVVYCDCPIHLYVCANLHQPLAFCVLHS